MSPLNTVTHSPSRGASLRMKLLLLQVIALLCLTRSDRFKPTRIENLKIQEGSSLNYAVIFTLSLRQPGESQSTATAVDSVLSS